MFENVAIWDYPIFELEKNAGNHILSHVSFKGGCGMGMAGVSVIIWVMYA